MCMTVVELMYLCLPGLDLRRMICDEQMCLVLDDLLAQTLRSGWIASAQLRSRLLKVCSGECSNLIVVIVTLDKMGLSTLDPSRKGCQVSLIE